MRGITRATGDKHGSIKGRVNPESTVVVPPLTVALMKNLYSPG